MSKKPQTRNPNRACSICNAPVYRRPSDLAKTKNIFCSQKCYRSSRRVYTCPACGNDFYPTHRETKTCSSKCSRTQRQGMRYRTGPPTRTSTRLKLLRETFEFSSCMVEDCLYSATYDIHRFIPGREGGEYVIGNMFAICPNHHAEIERGVSVAAKVSACVLRLHSV